MERDAVESMQSTLDRGEPAIVVASAAADVRSL
jgi:hypothetical protein